MNHFQQSIGNINIIENGLVIIHNETNTYASVCGLKVIIFKENIIFIFKLNI